MANQKKFIVDGGLHVSHDSQILANVEMGGHIIPNVDSDGTTGYDLGSPTMKWRDLYLSEGSLYIDNQKVVESSAGTIVVRADEDQSLTVKTEGTGVLTFQSDQTINMAATLQMSAGKRITDAGGDAVTFGDKVDMDGNKVINVGTPTANQDAANKAYVDDKFEDVVGGAPGVLDTLNEIANALGDDANFASTVLNNIAASKTDAINAAATDATTKANAAQASAEANASADATAKANAAEANAISAAASASATAIATATSNITNNYTTAISNEATAIANAYATAIATSETNITTAYQSYADNAISSLVSSSPEALNTLNELAAALNDDANFASTVTNNIATAKSEAISTAATDAQTKANQAKTDAVNTASTDATNKADQAEANAISTAAADATTKANAAESAANTYADSVVATEASNRATAISGAISTASADATAKANSAESNAINTAAADATAKANAAEASAVATASADATAKADAALVSAQAYADSAAANVSVDLSGYATETYVDSAVAGVVNGAPGALDTLNELAAAMGDDANFASTMTNSLAGKASLASDNTFTNANRFTVDSGSQIESAGSSSRFPIEVYAPANTDAAITFHVHNDYAGYLGLDYQSNDLFWGGWSVGASTKHRIWHAGNDGSGSGLDADTLDGKQASEFLTTSSSVDAQTLDGYDSSEFKKLKWRSFTVPGDINTFWPVLFPVSAAGNHAEEMIEIANTSVHHPTSGFGAFYIKFGANVTGWGHLSQMFNIYSYTRGGSNTYISKIRDVDHATNRIGVWLRGGSTYVYRTDHDISPTVVTTDNYMTYDNSNNAYDMTVSSTTSIEDAAFTEASTGGLRWQITADVNGNVNIPGNLTATGDVTAYSDDSLKTNVQVIDSALGRVEQVRGVTYDRIDDGSTSTGVIAQELEAVLPEAVKTDDNGVKSVAYGNITGLLIEAVKELSAQNKEMLEQIKQLKK